MFPAGSLRKVPLKEPQLSVLSPEREVMLLTDTLSEDELIKTALRRRPPLPALNHPAAPPLLHDAPKLPSRLRIWPRNEAIPSVKEGDLHGERTACPFT